MWEFSFLTLCGCSSARIIASCCPPLLSAEPSPSLPLTHWPVPWSPPRSFPSVQSLRLLAHRFSFISCIEALYEQPDALVLRIAKRRRRAPRRQRSLPQRRAGQLRLFRQPVASPALHPRSQQLPSTPRRNRRHP